MVIVTALQQGQGLTREDLDAMPDDGRRHELIDGMLVVTPSPAFRHQAVVGNLHLALRAHCPADLYVLMAPFDVALAADTVVEPDLLVARRADFTERDLPGAPLLVVEVLSPSTRRLDVTLKHSRYEAAGCPSYWVVDPDQPALTVWELSDGGYAERAHAVGEERVTVSAPYPLELVPARLLD